MELDGPDGIGFINDIEYAQKLSVLLDAYMKALEEGDLAAEVRAEDAARTLYIDQQMKVYRSQQSWTPSEEMQL